MATEITTTKQYHAPRFTPEQKEAWIKAKALLKSGKSFYRPLHVAMSELRLESGRKHKGPIETLPKNSERVKQHNLEILNLKIRERVNEWKDYLKDPSSKKLYIIVRDDLDIAQQAVQASHAAAEFVRCNPLAPWINGTVIVMVPDIASRYYTKFINSLDIFETFVDSIFYFIDFKTIWREPDQDNRITSVALLSEFQNERIGKQKGIKLL